MNIFFSGIKLLAGQTLLNAYGMDTRVSGTANIVELATTGYYTM